MYGFRDNHDVALVQPAKNHGSDPLIVLLCYRFQCRMIEYVILPSAKGAHASCWMPSCCKKALAACCWKNGCVSSWFTTGFISLCKKRSCRRSLEKLVTPIAGCVPLYRAAPSPAMRHSNSRTFVHQIEVKIVQPELFHREVESPQASSYS